MRLFILFAAVQLITACTSDDSTKPRSLNTSTASSSSSSSSTSSGNNGGEGGTGGAAGSGGAGGVDAGMGPTDAGAADPPCTDELAYWTLGMSFVAPTPLPLGQALSELAYDQSLHPLSMVLNAKGGIATATMGISATEDNAMGLQIFPTGTKPTFVPALLSYGSFQNGAPQAKGFLHIVDTVGAIDIELNNISVNMTTSSGCSNVLGVLNAEIPPSESGKTLHRISGDNTIGDLGSNGGGGGDKDAGPLPIVVRAFFTGETMSFDFASLK